jgi:hypothetical protein
MACLRLFTVPPLPPLPLFKLPRLNLCISRSTSFDALGEYFLAIAKSSSGYAGSSREVSDQGDQKQDKKDEEQDLRNSRRCAGDPTKSQSGSDEGDNQKH